MYNSPRNDRTIMDAVRASSNNQHTRAARLFQDAGNQVRNPSEKRDLWAAAERARRLANSD